MAIWITVTQGGMEEMSRTGVYPRYVYFHSESLKKGWRINLKDEDQKGSLKKKGIAVVNYTMDENGIRVQELESNGNWGDWSEPETTHILAD